MATERVVEPTESESRRPTGLDFAAALLLLATVVLHVVAMVPTYFVGTGSLMSQADQAALYSVLAAAWALALGIGLTGPHRTPVAAAIAVGVAVTELGFRVADLGDAIHYGTNTVGAGLWLMEAAWVIGAVAATVAVLAARARHGIRARPGEPSEWQIDWSAPVEGSTANPYAEHPAPVTESPTVSPEATYSPTVGPEATYSPAVGAEVAESPTTETGAVESPTVSMESPGAHDPTDAIPAARGGDTSVLNTVGSTEADAHERLAWTLLVAVLAALVAGSFLPAWDHAVAVSTQSGQTVSKSLGNAFSGPWQQVLGTVLAAAALLVVPVVAIRWRNRAVGAALVVGALLVLTSQLVAAVVQVDQPVPPLDFGISAQQARDLGLQLSLRLTGWFTLDALAAYALFAAVMVWATLRAVHENSGGMPPSTPDPRSDWIRSVP